jgi:hypothetical protein
LIISSNATTSPEYNLLDDTSEFNVGAGVYIDIPAASGLGFVFPGMHRNFYISQNTGGGYWVEGTSTTPVDVIMLFDSFLGQDGNDELHLDTGITTSISDVKMISNVHTEGAGTYITGPTAIPPGVGTPASGVGYGVYISSATARVDIVGGSDYNNSYSGIYTLSANSVTISSRRELNNNVAASTYSGIDIAATSGLVNISGGFSGNTTSSFYQKYGVNNSGGATTYATGLVCQLNKSSNHSGTVTVTPSGTC